jgi:uncharacterized OsmC-like protein
MGRKISNEEEARRCLAAAAASGRTRTEWARARGIDARSLNAWRINLEGAQRGHAPRLVELVAATPARPATYRVRCGSFEVETSGDFDDDSLRRLLRLVAAC